MSCQEQPRFSSGRSENKIIYNILAQNSILFLEDKTRSTNSGPFHITWSMDRQESALPGQLSPNPRFPVILTADLEVKNAPSLFLLNVIRLLQL